ncbi:MAG: hypothetical protein ACJA1W_004434 [Akkermansiaceae bacterium]
MAKYFCQRTLTDFGFAIPQTLLKVTLMKLRRHHLIIASLILLGITFLVIGVLHQSPPLKYYAHSLRNWQEADSVAGYPIFINEADEGSPLEFLTTEFQPNLSTMSPMERLRLPTAHGFERTPGNEARAASAGLVLYTGNPAGYEGMAVLLGHRLPNRAIVQTFFSGLAEVKVKVDQQVPRGTILGKGIIHFEVRQGVSIDIAKEEIEGLVLNSQDSEPPPNRLNVDDFFAKHALSDPRPDPLSIIQENAARITRQKLGLE